MVTLGVMITMLTFAQNLCIVWCLRCCSLDDNWWF